jgi:hypothetical protein
MLEWRPDTLGSLAAIPPARKELHNGASENGSRAQGKMAA